MNSDNKASKEVKEILDENHLKSGGILVGTQMIVEGISFLDDDILAIRFYRNMLPEYIVQLSYRARKSEAKPVIKFYQSGDEFQLKKESDYQYTFDKIRAQNFNKDVSQMARNFIGDTPIKILVEQQVVKKKVVPVEVPYIIDDNVAKTPQLNLMLLGYFSLEKISQALNTDIFSLLAHLRKWNFKFSFSTAEKSFVRKEFKAMRASDHKDMLRNNFTEITKYKNDELGSNKKSPIYVAWLFTQFLRPEYFLRMEADAREQFFFNKKSYQALADEVMGSILLNEKSMLCVHELLSKDFGIVDRLILTKIKSVDGYPNKISNENLAIEFVDLNITINTIKKVLKKYYMVSEARISKNIDDKSTRYFGLSLSEKSFVDFLIPSSIINLHDNPF